MNMQTLFPKRFSNSTSFIMKSYATYRRGKMPKFVNLTQKQKLVDKFIKKEVKITKSFEKNKHDYLAESFNTSRKEVSIPYSRKLHKLDVIFMTKISELLSTTDYGAEIISKQIEITKIAVQIDLSCIHIYWKSVNSIAEEELIEIFSSASRQLRQALVNEYIIGRVPPLVFVKDTSYEYKDRIKNLLDLVSASNSKDELDDSFLDIQKEPQTFETIEKELSDSLWDEINKKNEDLPPIPILSNTTLPVLTQNTLGVHRDRIMANIKKNMKLSQGGIKSPQIPNFNQKDFISPTYIKNPSLNVIEGTRTSDIRNWAKKYRNLKKKKQLEMNGQHESVIYDSVEDLSYDYDDTNIYEEEMLEENAEFE